MPMAENCKNCGLELFVGQRFCRACGAATEELSDEQAPTRRMPLQQEDWGARSAATTGPASRPDTSPVYAPPTTGYQPTVPPMYPQAYPPYAPPPPRSRVGWILAFIGIGLFAAVVFAVMMVARIGRRAINTAGGAPASQSARQGETVFDESSADAVATVGADTTFTKTFALGDGAKFSIKNVNGNITVSTWDQPKAEVNVIKRGGSDRGAQVFFTNSGGNLSIRAGQNRGNQDVRFEVKLPHELGRVELSSVNGVIKLSDVTAELLIDATNGAIELVNVVTTSKIHTVNGSIKANLLEASDRSMEFESTNGSIDLTVPRGFEADLEASTVHGNINIDETFGVQVEKVGVVGQKVKGEIGQGGERLKLATTNGNLWLRTAEPRVKKITKGKENGN